MATHSSILAWRIPWTEEPGGLQSMGSQRIRHDWATNTTIYICICIYIYAYTHTHTHIVFYTVSHYDSLRKTGHSPPCYPGGPCCLPILDVIVCTMDPKLPVCSSPCSPPPAPLWRPQVWSLSLWICSCSFAPYFRALIYMVSHGTCLSFSDFLHLLGQSGAASMMLQMAACHSSCGWAAFLWCMRHIFSMYPCVDGHVG